MKSASKFVPVFIVLAVVLILSACNSDHTTQTLPSTKTEKVINMVFEEGYLNIETNTKKFTFDYHKDAVFSRGEDYEILYINDKKILNVPSESYDKFILIFEEQRSLIVNQTN